MSTRSSLIQTNELENPKANENLNSLWPRMCRDFATLEQHLLSRVNEDALERHDETLEDEPSVCGKEKTRMSSPTRCRKSSRLPPEDRHELRVFLPRQSKKGFR